MSSLVGGPSMVGGMGPGSLPPNSGLVQRATNILLSIPRLIIGLLSLPLHDCYWLDFYRTMLVVCSITDDGLRYILLHLVLIARRYTIGSMVYCTMETELES